MTFETFKQGATSALVALSCALALGSGAAAAESACKGLEQSACEKAADCIWVGGYQKKDGKQVAGYCRTKSAGAAAGDKAGAAGATSAAPTGAKTPAAPAAPSATGTAKEKAKMP